jgi:hypothetical protein
MKTTPPVQNVSYVPGPYHLPPPPPLLPISPYAAETKYVTLKSPRITHQKQRTYEKTPCEFDGLLPRKTDKRSPLRPFEPKIKSRFRPSPNHQPTLRLPGFARRILPLPLHKISLVWRNMVYRNGNRNEPGTFQNTLLPAPAHKICRFFEDTFGVKVFKMNNLMRLPYVFIGKQKSAFLGQTMTKTAQIRVFTSCFRHIFDCFSEGAGARQLTTFAPCVCSSEKTQQLSALFAARPSFT